MKYLGNNLFDDFFMNTYGSYNTNNILYDVVENENNYILQLALPGFNKNDISVEINNNTLFIKAERLFDDNLNFVKKSTIYGKIEKKFTLPENVDTNIDARFENGLLMITLKKVKNNKLIKIL